jgi:hypothetical protein
VNPRRSFVSRAAPCKTKTFLSPASSIQEHPSTPTHTHTHTHTHLHTYRQTAVERPPGAFSQVRSWCHAYEERGRPSPSCLLARCWSQTTSCHMDRCVFTICFTICLCISPDLDGNRGITKMCPERPTKGPKTQIRSHGTAGASNHRLP